MTTPKTYEHPEHERIKALSGHDLAFSSLETIESQTSGWRCLLDRKRLDLLRRYDPKIWGQALEGNEPFWLSSLFIAALSVPFSFLTHDVVFVWAMGMSLNLVALGAGCVLFDAIKLLRNKWSEHVFLARLHGVPREGIKALFDCQEVKDSSKSKLLLHHALEMIDQVKGEDILRQHLGDQVAIAPVEMVEVEETDEQGGLVQRVLGWSKKQRCVPHPPSTTNTKL